MKNVQDIYPATPMQEFMLLHGLGHSHNDTLFNQFVFSVDHPLSTSAFERAWQQVVEAHAALRTAFIWKGVDLPQQVVRQTVELPCEVIDLSDLPEDQQEAEFEQRLAQDRANGFDFRRAPLLRFMLVKFGRDRWRVVWSSHHLIVDRWCIDQLINEFQDYYRGHRLDQPVSTRRAPSFRDYAAWIHQQSRADALAHWTTYLRGFDRPVTMLRVMGADPSVTLPLETSAKLDLGNALTLELREISARAGVTLSCVVQAAIGMTFNALSNSSDIVFGMTVAGRPALPHVESIVGSFISTLPVRVSFSPGTFVNEWLRELNAAQFGNVGYDYLSPAQFRACAAIPADRPLFDLLMVWLAQTNVDERSPQRQSETLPLVAMSEQYATAYPLTLSIIERSDRLLLRIDTASDAGAQLTPLLATLREQLDRISAAALEDTLEQFSGLSLGQRNPDSAGQQSDSAVFQLDAQTTGAVKRSGREDVRLDAMQEVIRSEWQSVLVLDKVGLNDDFFELGGDSLKAATLHTRLEAATRKAIPLLALFEHSSVTGMAQTLVDEKWPLRDGIAVPLRTSGSEAPLFCVASPEVNTLGYAMLARHLPERRNLVLLQAPPRGDELEQLHPDELEEFASRYVEALRRVQPKGPYSFLSMCSGAQVAFYMTRQLEREGEHVQFAGVINTWSLYSISWRFYLNRLINVSEYYVRRLRDVVTARLGSRLSSQAALSLGADGQGQHVSSQVSTETAPHAVPQALKVVPAESAVGLDNPWIRRVGFSHLLPGDLAIKTPVTVFRLRAQPYWRTGGEALGWSRLSSDTCVVHIEGNDHDAILREPHVQQVALQLDAALARSSRVTGTAGQ